MRNKPRELRSSPPREELAAWREELRRWGWTLRTAGPYYWDATSPDGLIRLWDNDAKKLYHHAIDFIEYMERQPRPSIIILSEDTSK